MTEYLRKSGTVQRSDVFTEVMCPGSTWHRLAWLNVQKRVVFCCEDGCTLKGTKFEVNLPVAYLIEVVDS